MRPAPAVMMLRAACALTVLTLLASCTPAPDIRENFGADEPEPEETSISSHSGQSASRARVSNQAFIEDSSRVFWTAYPDPFCCPCPEDTHPVRQAISFYCELPGDVAIGVLDSGADSVVHAFDFPTDDRRNYTFWPCCSATEVDESSLDARYRPISTQYLVMTDGPFRFILIVDNRKKTIFPYDIRFPKDHYCFIRPLPRIEREE